MTQSVADGVVEADVNPDQMVIRLTAQRLGDLIDPELFICDLCTSVVLNPQKHFRWHETLLHTSAGADLFTPFLAKAHELPEEPTS